MLTQLNRALIALFKILQLNKLILSQILSTNRLCFNSSEILQILVTLRQLPKLSFHIAKPLFLLIFQLDILVLVQ
jgi:hypothetical protein